MSFRIRPTPQGSVNAGMKVLAAPKAEVFEHVHRTDDYDDLFEAAKELGAPDHEVGSTTPTEGNASASHSHSDHVEVPIYPDAIPWPKVTAKTPYKLKEK